MINETTEKKQNRLIFYTSAEATEFKKFPGNISLEEFISTDYPIEKNSVNSEGFQLDIISNVFIIEGLKVYKSVFENGVTISLISQNALGCKLIVEKGTDVVDYLKKLDSDGFQWKTD